jgi:superfamily II DNA or RNA helicase
MRTDRIYYELILDELSLEALLGEDLYAQVSGEGFHGLGDVGRRKADFHAQFGPAAGLGDETVEQFVEVVESLIETREALPSTTPWHHADLVGSPFPRPYQYESYSVFRGSGYQGHLVEAPTGSGKTMIGMMCIQDWMRTMTAGQSILVLVPTSNYLQQWVGELCYKPIGLRLSPEVVFAGTPSQLEKHQRRTGAQPAVILMTYTALSQIGSPRGKGGFDIDSIEMFLQGANVQRVILDEVHKTVENMRSVSASVTRLLVEWLEDGSIRGLIGFSGTAAAYRARFAQLGLHLAHSISVTDLVGYGFVAPFAIYGVPFSDSTREGRIRDLLADYKKHMRSYFKLVGGPQLRAWFSGVPMSDRVAVARDLLGIYRGRSDAEQALALRMTAWEQGGALRLNEAPLVSILQVCRGWSDQDLVLQAGAEERKFGSLVGKLEQLRQELDGLIHLPRTRERLLAPGFASTLDVERLRNIPHDTPSIAARIDRARAVLSVTIVGLYRELGDWYYRVGEGRVEVIKSVIEAERQARPVSKVIIFDQAKRIRWRKGTPQPGYAGLGGLFAESLGDPRFTVMAALSSELYLTHDESDPLPPRLAEFVETELLKGELADAIFGLATQGLQIEDKDLDILRSRFLSRIDAYIPQLSKIRRPRLGEFSRKVLATMRRFARSKRLGQDGARLRARLTVRNVHLARLIETFFDYAALADGFRRARVAELEQASGAVQKFFVVPMPGGRRKTLMYDLTSRIVDAESLPINLIIVSTWARTGWNVISPNLLIDATATRDVTAWQQLQGRAMRALSTWTNDCYRLIRILTETELVAGTDDGALTEELAAEVQQAVEAAQSDLVLDDNLQELLDSVVSPEQQERIAAAGLASFGASERQSLAVDLLLSRNKVTHVYEMVKAYGSTTQVGFHRPTKTWRRRKPIADKHRRAEAVNPLTGELLQGVAYTPLIYASDPRKDRPVVLAEKLVELLKDRDPLIVAGWMRGSDPEPST